MATKSTTFSESNINVENNTSSLTINIYFKSDYYETFFRSATLYCTCNGVTKDKTVSLQKGGSVNTSFLFSDILHNEDGTKTVSWEWNCDTGTTGLGNISDSGTKALTTIPRNPLLELKVNGIFKKGKVRIKRDGAWKNSKKIFIKVNGVWKESALKG